MNREFSERFEARQLAIKKIAERVSDDKPENDNPRSILISAILKTFQKEDVKSFPTVR